MSDWQAKDSLLDPVDQHMRTDFVQLRPELTVAEALETIRQKQPGERIIYFYVTDAVGRLQGVVPTRRLLLSPSDKPIAEIMIKPVVVIPRTATVLDACEFFILHKLLAFPVVDEDHRIIGLVDVELYTRELSDLDRLESHSELFQLIGVHLTEAQQRSIPSLFRRRFPWLLATLAGGLAAAVITDLYLDVATLALVVPFIPLVLGLAGSVSSQSVSLAIRTLHGQQPAWRRVFPKFRAELTTGTLLGLTCGILAGLAVLAWKGTPMAAIGLVVSVAGGVVCAGILGLAMPYLLRWVNRSPHVAAGPIALAAADLVALLVYFNLSRWFLG